MNINIETNEKRCKNIINAENEVYNCNRDDFNSLKEWQKAKIKIVKKLHKKYKNAFGKIEYCEKCRVIRHPLIYNKKINKCAKCGNDCDVSIISYYDLRLKFLLRYLRGRDYKVSIHNNNNKIADIIKKIQNSYDEIKNDMI